MARSIAMQAGGVLLLVLGAFGSPSSMLLLGGASLAALMLWAAMAPEPAPVPVRVRRRDGRR